MDSHQGSSRARHIASSTPIVDEAPVPTLPSQIDQLGATNPFTTFQAIENIPPASRPVQPPQQSIPTSPQHVAQSHPNAQQQRQSYPSMQRLIQPPASRFNGAPHHAQVGDMTNNNAPGSSNVELALQLQTPSYTAFPQHDYAALVADAPDITSFMDSFPGHLQGMKFIKDPPDLDTWRNILFHVDEMIALSEEQYAFLACSASLWTQRLKA